jgi:hypothetical protein
VTDRIEAAAKEFARLIWQRESNVSEVLKSFPDLTDAEIDLAWQRARAWSERFLEQVSGALHGPQAASQLGELIAAIDDEMQTDGALGELGAIKGKTS